MAAMLGYDAELVAGLDAAMRRSLGDLDRVRSNDVVAAAAMRNVNRCRAMLRDTWLPFTSALLSCASLDGVRPVMLEADDLLARWAAALVTRPGWQLRTDGTDEPAAEPLDTSPLTADQARTLAVLLSGPAGAAPLDAATASWLAGLLRRIASDSRLTAAFLPAFTTTGWTALCNTLAIQRQRAVTEALMFDGRISSAESEGWAGIDATFAALGSMVAADHGRHPLSRPTLLLDDLTPMAAALLAQHLALDATTLADLTRSLVAQERILIDRTPEIQLGERAADVLFRCLLHTPGAPTAYVLAVRDDPSLLLEVAFEPASGVEVATVGTKPSNMRAEDAASAVPALARWFLDASHSSNSMIYNPALAVGAADVMAPYLLPILRSTHDGWGLSRSMRRGIEHLLMNDDTAFQRVLARRNEIASEHPEPLPADPQGRIAALRDIADLLAFIDTMRRSRTIHRAEEERAEWELMWNVIGYGENLLPIAGPASAAVSVLVGIVHYAVDHADWAPGDVPGARAGSLTTFDRLTTVAAAALVATSFDEMVTSGRIAPGTPPPPVPDLTSKGSDADVGVHYSEAFVEWVETSGIGTAVAYELVAIKQAIASDHETTADANDVLLKN